jgi:hypothetical protein
MDTRLSPRGAYWHEATLNTTRGKFLSVSLDKDLVALWEEKAIVRWLDIFESPVDHCMCLTLVPL